VSDYNKNELIKIVGVENIFDDPQALESYSRDKSFVPPRQPRLVVKAKNTTQVHAIVKWANETGTPLVPVSSGPPHFRGDTVPTVPDAAVVDLSEMKRIISVDVRNRVVVIEPGVTFSQLQPELAKKALRISTPLLPRGNKSVLASLLEREPTIIPKYHYSMLEPLRCLGLVWGNGEAFDTGGSAAGVLGIDSAAPGKDQGLPLIPWGPAQNDWYRFVAGAQGSMAIATWASVRCKILPQIHQLFFVPAKKLDDLLGFAYKVLRFRYGDEFLFLNNSNLAAIIGKGANQIRALREELPPWVLILGIAGGGRLSGQRVEFQEKDLIDIARQFSLQLVSAIPGRNEVVPEALLYPSPEPYWKLGYKGGCQDIFFVTTLDRTPEFIKTVNSIAEALGYSPLELGTYIQPLLQGTCCHCEFTLPYDSSNPDEVTKIQRFFITASEQLMNQGAFFSRPYGMWADMTYSRDVPTATALKKIKGIFDPNNVMNPGKLCF